MDDDLKYKREAKKKVLKNLLFLAVGYWIMVEVIDRLGWFDYFVVFCMGFIMLVVGFLTISIYLSIKCDKVSKNG